MGGRRSRVAIREPARPRAPLRPSRRQGATVRRGYDLPSVSETWYENRPCLSDECRGEIRRFKIMTSTTGSGKVLARVMRCTWCGYEPGARGSARLDITADIGSSGEVVPAPQEAGDQTERLEEIGFSVVWRSLSEGFFLVVVSDDAGDLIDGGVGDDPVEMILGVAERLLPP